VRELALYFAAGAVYIAVGVAVPEVLFAWIACAVYLLLAVWVLPEIVRRLR
jgi:hypothetical protein